MYVSCFSLYSVNVFIAAHGKHLAFHHGASWENMDIHLLFLSNVDSFN